MSDAPRYRRLFALDWHDPAFRTLNDAARVVRFYVSAGPQTTSVGCFRLSTAVAIEDLGGTAEAFEQRLETVCEAFSWAWDPLARVVWITNWFDQNPPANPNVVHAWAKLLRNVPDCDIKTHAIADINQRLKELPASFREPWRELSKSFPVGESKAQSRTETIQGAGEQGIQGSGIRGTGLRKKAGFEGKRTNDNGSGSEPSPQLLRLVRETLKLTHGDVDHYVDAVLNQHGQYSRPDVVVALNVVLAERQAAVS